MEEQSKKRQGNKEKTKKIQVNTHNSIVQE